MILNLEISIFGIFNLLGGEGGKGRSEARRAGGGMAGQGVWVG